MEVCNSYTYVELKQEQKKQQKIFFLDLPCTPTAIKCFRFTAMLFCDILRISSEDCRVSLRDRYSKHIICFDTLHERRRTKKEVNLPVPLEILTTKRIDQAPEQLE